jgi:DNA-binding GntR family transcriptional regulator
MTQARETMAEAVAASLRQAIQDGFYICGDRLVELAIAQEMGVSQNTAREALYILEREGWAQKRPRCGSFVRGFTRDEVEELYALWASVAGLALAWMLEHIPRTHLTQSLIPVIESARAQVDASNTHGVLASLFAFHEALTAVLEHSGKRTQTAALLMRLHNQARLLELARARQQPRSRAEWDALVAEYEYLMGMIKFANSADAKEAISGRIEADGRAVLGALY